MSARSLFRGVTPTCSLPDSAGSVGNTVSLSADKVLDWTDSPGTVYGGYNVLTITGNVDAPVAVDLWTATTPVEGTGNVVVHGVIRPFTANVDGGILGLVTTADLGVLPTPISNEYTNLVTAHLSLTSATPVYVRVLTDGKLQFLFHETTPGGEVLNFPGVSFSYLATP